MAQRRGSTRKPPTDPFALLQQEIDDLRSQIEAGNNNRRPTIPLYDAGGFPAVNKHGQLARTALNDVYVFGDDNAWHKIGSSSVYVPPPMCQAFAINYGPTATDTGIIDPFDGARTVSRYPLEWTVVHSAIQVPPVNIDSDSTLLVLDSPGIWDVSVRLYWPNFDPGAPHYSHPWLELGVEYTNDGTTWADATPTEALTGATSDNRTIQIYDHDAYAQPVANTTCAHRSIRFIANVGHNSSQIAIRFAISLLNDPAYTHDGLFTTSIDCESQIYFMNPDAITY